MSHKLEQLIISLRTNNFIGDSSDLDRISSSKEESLRLLEQIIVKFFPECISQTETISNLEQQIRQACSLLGVFPQSGLILPLSHTGNCEGIPVHQLNMLLLLLEMGTFQNASSSRETNKEILLLDCVSHNKKRSSLFQHSTKHKPIDISELNANVLFTEKLLNETQKTLVDLRTQLDKLEGVHSHSSDNTPIGIEVANLLENLQIFGTLFTTNIKPWLKMQKGVHSDVGLISSVDEMTAVWEQWSYVQSVLRDLPNQYDNCLRKSHTAFPVSTTSENKITNLKLQATKLDRVLTTKHQQLLFSRRDANSLSPMPADFKSAI